MQTTITKIVKSNIFEYFILGVIIFAGILVGIETNSTIVEKYNWLINFLDHLIILIFVVEFIFKIIAEGNQPWKYFQSGWNIFDFAIIITFFLPINTNYIIVVRLLRILRFLRLIRVLPRLQVIVNAMLASLPSMGYILLLLLIVFYIYGVLANFLFSTNDPVHFGNLSTSMLTLFRIVTFEDWTDIMYLNMYGCDSFETGNPYPEDLCVNPSASPFVAAVFFISFALIGAMIFLNLFIGIITSSVEEYQHKQRKEEEILQIQQEDENLDTELLKLKIQLKTIESTVEKIRLKIASDDKQKANREN